MWQMRDYGACALVRTISVLVATAGAAVAFTGSNPALAGTGPRRSDMLAAGVDPMPVGTAKQVERAKAARLQRP